VKARAPDLTDQSDETNRPGHALFYVRVLSTAMIGVIGMGVARTPTNEDAGTVTQIESRDVEIA